MVNHGTYEGYKVQACRCDACKSWKFEDNLISVQQAQERGVKHGTNSAYRHGCRCEECKAAKSRENSVSNPRRYDSSWKNPNPATPHKNLREAYLVSKYGLTLSQYEERVESQRGKCAICDEVPSENLYVDHCHDTGKVRELLCRHCNTALGFARDNVRVLRSMIAYLERHPKW